MPDMPAKKITLIWTDGADEVYGVPSLEIHVDGVETFEDMDKILRMAFKCIEAKLTIPRFHMFTKDYDDEQAAKKGA